eukprot:Skav208166  [mRNA]  locus=scaffold1044:108674:116093:- [translate_table: standard]
MQLDLACLIQKPTVEAMAMHRGNEGGESTELKGQEAMLQPPRRLRLRGKVPASTRELASARGRVTTEVMAGGEAPLLVPAAAPEAPSMPPPRCGSRALRWLPCRQRWSRSVKRQDRGEPPASFRAKLFMKDVGIQSKSCNLKTALEFLCILMADAWLTWRVGQGGSLHGKATVHCMFDA